jgi:hypothetical protein
VNVGGECVAKVWRMCVAKVCGECVVNV